MDTKFQKKGQVFSLSELIIKKSFNLSVWIIRRFCDSSKADSKIDELKKMKQGTLGNRIAKCLEENKVYFVPGYESHDLKHVVLDYKMTPLDEIRMQAFMLGNGNYTFPCVAILLFGLILLPGKWSLFIKDFKKGRNSGSIALWTIEEYASIQVTELQRMILGVERKKKYYNMNKIIRIGAYTATFAGIAGMLFCLPFLFSASLADLVGAGFPFVGGAILVAGGLISLSNLSKGTQALSGITN